MITIVTKMVVKDENLVDNKFEHIISSITTMMNDSGMPAKVTMMRAKIKPTKTLKPMIRKIMIDDTSKIQEVVQYMEGKGCEVTVDGNMIEASKVNGRGGFHKMALVGARLGGGNSRLVE